MIGIIGAMDIEVEGIKSLFKNPEEEVISNIKFISGKLGNEEAVVAKCGIGKVFAAICAEAMILNYHPDYIINVGVGGTLTNKLSIGNLAISDSVVEHDMDTSPLGDELGFISEINMVKIPADKNVLAKVEDAAKKTGLKYEIGTIASGDQFICEAGKKEFISKNFGAIACEMEGASVGHVCCVNNIPFVIVRSISDGADDGANMAYTEFMGIAAQNSIAVIKNLVGVTEV